MLSLLTEWNDAPGVKDPVLAATWARLEIKDESAAESKWLSRVIRSTTNSVDRGVYGPMFPLAEWIVENWWFLFHEGCRVPEIVSGRRLASDPVQRAWVQRHNLLAAREGGACPNLTIFRDGNAICLKWAPDPDHDSRIRRMRFVEQGTALVEPADVECSLQQFIEAVLDASSTMPAIPPNGCGGTGKQSANPARPNPRSVPGRRRWGLIPTTKTS